MSLLTVPKSAFKPKAFSYLRRVAGGDRICITDHGRPVADIVPHRAHDDQELSELRGLVCRFDRPLAPVGIEWEAQK